MREFWKQEEIEILKDLQDEYGSSLTKEKAKEELINRFKGTKTKVESYIDKLLNKI